MTIRFYVGEDGEVLSNRIFPVKANLCLIPEVENGAPVYGEVASALFLQASKVRFRLYKAVTVHVPEGFVRSEDGAIR